METPTPSQVPPNDSGASPSAWSRTVLWLAGSAFFGSLALVLWNRQVLKSLREAEGIQVETPGPRDDDGIY